MKIFWSKKVPSFLLAVLLLISLTPVVGAASADLEKSVRAGDSVSLDRSDFRDLYNADRYVTSNLSYIEFTDYSDLDDFGHLTAFQKNGSQVTLDEYRLKNTLFHYYADGIGYNSDCSLAGLTFVANRAARGTLSLRFIMYGENRHDQVNGRLNISIDGSGSSHNRVSLTYTVNPGDTLSLRDRDFRDLFNDNASGRFFRMEFKKALDLDNYGRFYSTDYNRNRVYFNHSDLHSGWFYYDSSDMGTNRSSYSLSDLTFEADRRADGKTVALDFTLEGISSRDSVDGTLYIQIGKDTSRPSRPSRADITYTVEENSEVTFDRRDFEDFFRNAGSNLSSVRFTSFRNLDKCGQLYSYDARNNRTYFDESNLNRSWFYFSSRDMTNDGSSYTLDDLTFSAGRRTDGETVVLDFTAYGERDQDRMDGSVVIEIGRDHGHHSRGTITYEAAPRENLPLKQSDFQSYFREIYRNRDFRYLEFTSTKNLGVYNGDLYSNYGRGSQVQLDVNALRTATFYCDARDISSNEKNSYALDDLSFVASDFFDTPVTLEFRTYDNSSRYVDGSVVISPKKSATPTPSNPSTGLAPNILYATTTGKNVQLNANDFARYFQAFCPGSTFQSVTLSSVPASGSLYYNYYGTSSYGGAARTQLTTYNCSTISLYANPATLMQYSLSELTYVPSGANYCATIPFTAYGSHGYSVSGNVLISVTQKVIPEVYGVTPRNTAVNFPAPALASAVSSGTSTALSKIQLTKLPDSKVGTIYVGSGTTQKATTADQYGTDGSSWQISQLRFVPASNYTGSVEIPYIAYNGSGTAIGTGRFCLGIVNSVKRFKDVPPTSWCYKYVTELSDAKVIDGYKSGTFKPDSKISYGAALKLIMLAAGYPEQAPTSKNVFSGYLAKARAEGIVTRSDINLNGPITRLQVAQLAAGALKLDTSSLSSVNPFNDTKDPQVQALNAAGIVEGYFSNGVNSYKPNNTLTRGQVSAIVWRMLNYKK